MNNANKELHYLYSAMDFLKSFAEAKSLGITKEEFIPQWEAQINATRVQAESRLLELRQQVGMPTQLFAEREMNLNALLEGQLNVVHQEINNLRLECQQTFDSFQSQLTHLKNQQDELKMQMFEECSVNLNSMKVYVQNEVQLLSESIERKMDFNFKENKLSTKDNCGGSLNHQSPQPVQMSKEESSIELYQHFYQQQQSHQEGTEESYVDQVGYGHQLEQENHSFQIIQEQHPVNGIRDVIEFGWDSTTKPKDEITTGKVHMSYAAVAALDPEDDFEQILKPGVDDGTNGYLASGHGISDLAMLQNATSPVLATGQYAEIISRRMAVKKQGSRSRSRGKSGPLVPHNVLSAGKIIKFPLSKALTSSSVFPMSSSGEEFKISDCSKFSTSKTDYYTSTFFTSPLRCKVRLRLRFNDNGFFNVSLLVSQGPDDGSIRWPVKLSGKGEIFNHGSRKYTPLWDFEISKCPKPHPSTELSFEANVRLTTSRGVHDEVTYKKLQAKRYEFQDSLAFRWNVTVEDKLLNNS